MHLPFIAHTCAHQMYVTITCTRLKHAFRFISCLIVLISVQDDGNGCDSTSKDELPQKRVFSKQYTFTYTCYCDRASQSRVLTRQSPFTTRVKRLVISVYLNSVCYLISYTRLFMKLNLFEILLYALLTTKFSRSTVVTYTLY